jgi:hypothetical protein
MDVQNEPTVPQSGFVLLDKECYGTFQCFSDHWVAVAIPVQGQVSQCNDWTGDSSNCRVEELRWPPIRTRSGSEGVAINQRPYLLHGVAVDNAYSVNEYLAPEGHLLETSCRK